MLSSQLIVQAAKKDPILCLYIYMGLILIENLQADDVKFFWILWLQNKQNTAVHPLKHNYKFWLQWYEGTAGSFTGDAPVCLWNAETLLTKVCEMLIKLKLYEKDHNCDENTS
jgi:hypothetical protein